MHERTADLVELQRTIDASFAAAGPHLQEVATPDRRPTAAEIAERLTGMRLLVLATTTRDGRPINGPVDGIFYRGRFHFGSSPASLRFRHIRERPQVSATHLPGEELAVTVHGTAEALDLTSDEHSEFRQVLIDIYLPQYGDAWLQVLNGGVYARIEPERVFAFWMPKADEGGETSS